MELIYFIGTDVSKHTLDFAVRKGKAEVFHKCIENTPAAIKVFFSELCKITNFSIGNSIFCMEHTGIYNNYLLDYLHKKKANICLEAASQIKNSLGNLRGKNDKLDALRIAEYAYKNREELRLWQPKREVIQKLTNLSATRSRLIDSRKMLETPLNEGKKFMKKSIIEKDRKLCAGTLKSISMDLEKVEKAIQEIIHSDPELKRLFGLITSVSGVGKVIAVQVLITTNEFKNIKEAKKFACYAGVVPFTKESGLFKGKARVSHFANKKIKTLLHMGAISSIACNGEMKEYYKRKTEEENKNPMNVINAIRNKLVLRIFACVTQNRKYEKNYVKSVA